MVKVLVIGGGVTGCAAVVGIRKFDQDVRLSWSNQKVCMYGCRALVPLEVRITLFLILCCLFPFFFSPIDHCEVYWASYRSPFDEAVADNSLYLLEKWAEKFNVQHIRSVAKKLTATEATLANIDTIAFDVCVVSTGSDAKAKFLGRGLPATDGTKETLGCKN